MRRDGEERRAHEDLGEGGDDDGDDGDNDGSDG